MTDLTPPALGERLSFAVKAHSWENKAVRPGASESADAHDAFLHTFEAFKETNDERLDQLERRMSADVVTTEKLARIDRALDEQKRTLDDLALKAARPQRGGAAPRIGAASEHKTAFEGYMRRGEAHNLRRLEEKALSAGTDADGGYLVPDEIEAGVMRALRDASPIRAIAGVRQVSSNTYKKPFAITGAATGWVAETATRSQTTSPTLAELAFPTMELYAMPAATQTLLEDAAVNIDEWVAEEVRVAFAEQENLAFVSGDGSNKPKGFLAYTTIAEASWAWDKIGYLTTGVSGGFPASDPADKAHLHAEIGLPRERALGAEPRHARRDPQDQGRRRQLHLAAWRSGRGEALADGLPHRRDRGHARYRREQLRHCLRRFRPGLPGCG
jgi:HK97 family phage major capsid protein